MKKRQLVEWKDGVHVAGTPVWCDARRARDACFVSSARVAEARRHRQVIATEATRRLFPEAPRSTLAVPCGRPFALGDVRLELFPSGSMVGAASLSVEARGTRVVYAGAVNPRGGGLGGAAEVRACDALVVDAAFGEAHYRFPDPAAVADELAGWVDEVRRDGTTPVILADPLGGALEVLRVLGGRATPDTPIVAHRAIVAAARRVTALGSTLAAVRRLGRTPPAGAVVLWPVGSTEEVRAPRVQRALVGPWAQDRAKVKRLGVDAAFAWSDQADRPHLERYIQATGAREVYATNARLEVARALGAVPLGQLALF